MDVDIPLTQFRLEHNLECQPELTIDAGPGDDGYLMGQVASGANIEAIYLGKQAEPPFRAVWLDALGAHVLYVMGKRRSGKSYTLGVLAEGLASRSWLRQGETSQAVLVIDTMNVFLTMPFSSFDVFPDESSEMRDLRKWKIPAEEIPLTLYQPRGTPQPSSIITREIGLRPSDLGADEWCGLFEVDPFSDPLGHLMTEVHGKVALDGYIDNTTGASIASNEEFVISDLLRALANDGDLQRYHRDTREALVRRLHALNRLPVFSDNGLDIDELLQPGHISVLLLRDLEAQVRSALVAQIVKRMMARRGVAEQEERIAAIHASRAKRLQSNDPEQAIREEELAAAHMERAAAGLARSWLVIDEAHNYVPASGVNPARGPLKKYVDEGRNLGLSIVVATQNPAGLDPSLQRNADMLLVHSLSRQDDIAAAEKMLNTGTPNSVVLDSSNRFEGARMFERIIRNMPIGYALASTDRANRLFPVRMRPRSTVAGGADY